MRQDRIRLHSAIALAAGTLLAGWSPVTANTANVYTGSATGNVTTGSNWSLGTPTVAHDAVFPLGAATGIRNFGTGSVSGGDLTVGSWNVLATSNTFTLRNDTSADSTVTLTLGGAGNTGNNVSGHADDLLYVTGGSIFALTGTNGTKILNVVLGESGSFTAGAVTYSTGGNGTISVNAVLSDGGNGYGITKRGAGTLTLGAANTYTGGTTVEAGLLAVSATGSINSASALTFSGTGVFNRTAPSAGTTLAMGTLSFSGGFGTVQSTYGTADNAGLTFASFAAVGNQASGNFVTTGGDAATNRITLTGQAAGYLGPRLTYNGSNFAYYDAGGFVRGVNWGVDSGSSTQAGGASIASTDYAQTTAGITAQASATFTALNVVNTANTAQAFTLAAGATLQANAILRSGNGGGSSTTTMSGGTGLQPATVNSDLYIRTDQANDLLVLNLPILANGTNALVKSGLGRAVMGASATNAFSGGVYLQQGILGIRSDSQLGTSTAPVVFQGGTLRFDTSGLTIAAARPVTVTSAGGSLTGNTAFSGWTVSVASDLTGPGRFHVAANGGNRYLNVVVFSGNNSGLSGGLSIDDGTLEFRGANSTGSGPVLFLNRYSDVNRDVLRLRNDSSTTFLTSEVILPEYDGNGISGPTIDVGAITSGSGVLSLNTVSALRMNSNQSAKLNFTGSAGYSLAIGLLRISGNAMTLNPTTTSVAISTLTSGSSIQLGGTATGSSIGSVQSNGLTALSGTWTLTGTSTYTAPTNVNGGTLRVNGVLNAASAVTVAAAGTLSGNGTVGNVTVNGTLAPGASVGTLTAGNLTFNSGGKYTAEVDTATDTADKVITGGNVALGDGVATLDLSFIGPGGAYVEAFTLIDNTTANATTGYFAGLQPLVGTSYTYDSGAGLNFTIDYAGGTGNDVTVAFTSVPEPAGLAVVAVGGLALLARRRRRTPQRV